MALPCFAYPKGEGGAIVHILNLTKGNKADEKAKKRQELMGSSNH